MKHPIKLDYSPPKSPGLRPQMSVVRAVVYSLFWTAVFLSAILGVMFFAMELKYGRFLK